jgi:hypothetical protein
MNLVITNLTTQAQLVQDQKLCYNWTINLEYEFLAMSHIWLTMEATPTYCDQIVTNNNNQTTGEYVSSGSRPQRMPKGTMFVRRLC